MSDIRILINFDTWQDNYKNYLIDDRFKIDTRSITTIGENNSADTLTEYDAIILNFTQPINYIPERFRQIQNFLAMENKFFVFVLNRHVERNNQSNTWLVGALFQFYKGSSDIINITPSGSNYDIIDKTSKNIFYNYLTTQYKNWKISFYDRGHKFINPLAKNTDNNLVAFELSSEIIRAENAFIPWLANDEVEFWKTIKNYLLNKDTNFSAVAEWVNNYKFSQLVALEKQIEEKEILVNEIIRVKEQLEIQKQNYERIRNTLLYFDGDLLQEVCKEVLQFLGIAAENGKQGREDLVFIHDGNHFLIEVKGCEKSASKNHVRQVNSHVAEYKNEKEVEVKGILLINAWRKLPLEERDKPDTPLFPDEIMQLVGISGISLITTQQLFVMYCEKLEGKFDLSFLMNGINSTENKLNGYNSIIDYKIVE